jgi:hypothetical protein
MLARPSCSFLESIPSREASYPWARCGSEMKSSTAADAKECCLVANPRRANSILWPLCWLRLCQIAAPSKLEKSPSNLLFLRSWQATSRQEAVRDAGTGSRD